MGFIDYKKGVDFKVEKPTKKEIKKYTDETHDLAYMLVVDDERYPVFFDDYGQQEYIEFEGKTYGGGAFNSMAEYDFVYIIKNYGENKKR